MFVFVCVELSDNSTSSGYKVFWGKSYSQDFDDFQKIGGCLVYFYKVTVVNL